MELNVNRRNRALHFYERMGMRRLREGRFPDRRRLLYGMNYIMGLEIVDPRFQFSAYLLQHPFHAAVSDDRYAAAFDQHGAAAVFSAG